jgi:exonuclease III
MSEATETLKTVKQEKDTWVLEVPAEICRHEGFAEGTLVSLTFRNGEIISTYIPPSDAAKESAKRFVNKYSEFMKEAEEIGD